MCQTAHYRLFIVASLPLLLPFALLYIFHYLSPLDHFTHCKQYKWVQITAIPTQHSCYTWETFRISNRVSSYGISIFLACQKEEAGTLMFSVKPVLQRMFFCRWKLVAEALGQLYINFILSRVIFFFFSISDFQCRQARCSLVRFSKMSIKAGTFAELFSSSEQAGSKDLYIY